MMTPTTSPTSIIGAETSKSVTIASRATSITSGPVITLMLSPTLSRHAQAAPHQGAAATSNLHFQDIFIGRDHLVADRDHRLHGGFGFGDRGDDVDHIGLAVGHGLGLQVRFVRRLGDAIDDVFEHGAAVRSRALRRAATRTHTRTVCEARGVVAHAPERGVGIGGGGCRYGHGWLLIA